MVHGTGVESERSNARDRLAETLFRKSQVRLLDNIGNLSASRRCFWVYELQVLLSGILPAFQNLNNELALQRGLMSRVLPISTK